MVKNIISLFTLLAVVSSIAFSSGSKFLRPNQPKKAAIEIPSTSVINPSGARKSSPSQDSPFDLTWVMMDSMPNAYGPSNSDVNPLNYDPWCNAIAMIYRGHLLYDPPNPTTGSLWYGKSTDEFATWQRVAKLNADVDQYGRYPSSTISNPGHASDPSSTIFEYSYPHLTGGAGWGTLGYGLDPFGAGTPFTTLYTGPGDYASQTYITVSDDGEPNVYLIVERTTTPTTLEFWRTTNQGETWAVAASWSSEIDVLYNSRVHCKGNTVYVEVTTVPAGGDHIVMKINKSTDKGSTWSGWEIVDWRTISALSEYDDFGTVDGRIAHDFVVDANGNEHIFVSLIDTNATTGGFDIVEIYRDGASWSSYVVAPRTQSFKPGFAALSQMDNELFATISEDRNAIVVKWIDAPAEGDTVNTDIFTRGRIITQNWGSIQNQTQTGGDFGREMTTHIASRFENVGANNMAYVYLSKMEQLDPTVTDPNLDDTQPCALWGAKAMVDFTPGGGVNEREPGVPSGYSLYTNYPNPFNPTTKIAFDLPNASNVTLKVYDITGKEVATLFDGYQQAGKYEATFDASKLASGIYVAKMQAGTFTASQKMILTK
ncbi:MAG: T9SS type A sorting domain-containing protein [Ignavibacteria bacterium]|nr:T9SS type A sorting domain-containing protein [Ignavibacteria bacterium]